MGFGYEATPVGAMCVPKYAAAKDADLDRLRVCVGPAARTLNPTQEALRKKDHSTAASTLLIGTARATASPGPATPPQRVYYGTTNDIALIRSATLGRTDSGADDRGGGTPDDDRSVHSAGASPLQATASGSSNASTEPATATKMCSALLAAVRIDAAVDALAPGANAVAVCALPAQWHRFAARRAAGRRASRLRACARAV